MTDTSRNTVAENIRLLMAQHGMNKHSLSKRSGVSNRMIGKILAEDGSEPTTGTLDKLARAFGIAAWQLLAPNGCDNAAFSKRAERVFNAYTHANQDGRAIMETQADYLLGQKPANHGPGGPPRKKRASRS